jgi:hypothetical protein
VTADIGIIAILKAENNVSEKNRQNICAIFYAVTAGQRRVCTLAHKDFFRVP